MRLNSIGLEPMTFRLSSDYSTTELRVLVGVTGIEPVMAVPKTAALPLGYTPYTQGM